MHTAWPKAEKHKGRFFPLTRASSFGPLLPNVIARPSALPEAACAA